MRRASVVAVAVVAGLAGLAGGQGDELSGQDRPGARGDLARDRLVDLSHAFKRRTI